MLHSWARQAWGFPGTPLARGSSQKARLLSLLPRPGRGLGRGPVLGAGGSPSNEVLFATRAPPSGLDWRGELMRPCFSPSPTLRFLERGASMQSPWPTSTPGSCVKWGLPVRPSDGLPRPLQGFWRHSSPEVGHTYPPPPCAQRGLQQRHTRPGPEPFTGVDEFPSVGSPMPMGRLRPRAVRWLSDS